MPKIILCRGIQGSGKTTWAKQWVLEDPEHRVRFNNDDIRNMLGKYWVPSREVLVDSLKRRFLWSSMSYGFDIVIDNMNLNPKELEYYNKVLDIWNNPEEIVIELRIYQNNMVNAYVPSGEEIRTIMNRIIHADEIVRKCKKGEIM